MNTAEQDSLVLRQVAALRRSGLSQADALSRIAVPAGPLAVRVQAARAALAAGAPSDDLLGADAPADAFDVAASAIDARLEAVAALRMTRLYLALAVVITVGGLFLIGRPGAELLAADPQFATGLLLLARGRWLFVVLGACVLGLLYKAPELAPGVERLERAAALRAHRGDPARLITDTVEQAFFNARRAAVGPEAAAAELAAELVAEGRASVAWTRSLLSVAVVMIAGGVLWLAWLGAFGLAVRASFLGIL